MQINLDDPASWLVLVVDDEPDNLELMQDVLQYFGASVQCCHSGRLALQTLQSYRPNLIILDVSMPEMNGVELRDHIRAQAAFAGVPIVAVSAHAMVGDKEKLLQAGFDGYVSKPIRVANIVDDIRNSIRSNRHSVG
jgi:CheY-like chemotaxis protein